jgi:uncharacterized protein YecT (DUF1311 family)
MHKRRLHFLVAPVVLAPTLISAHAASFDCRNAGTPQEKAICASPTLSAEDDRLAAAYQAVLHAAPKAMVAEIRDGQRAWLASLTKTCWPGDPSSTTSLPFCLEQQYSSRTAALRHMVLSTGGVTFVWRSVSLIAPNSPDDHSVEGIVRPGFGTLTASWPQTKNANPNWQMWNAAIERATKRVASQNGSFTSGRWESAWAQDMDIDVDVSLSLVTADLVSVQLENNWYGHGAAHPNTEIEQMNWLLKERRKLAPGDVFRPNSGWDRMLESRCADALTKQFGPGYTGGYEDPAYYSKLLHTVVRDPDNWQFDRRGLTILYPSLTVSPRVDPAEPVLISWSELGPLLQPTFRPPQGAVTR